MLALGALLSCACRLADVLKSLRTFTFGMAKILNYLGMLVLLKVLRAVCPALYSMNNDCLRHSQLLLSSTEMLSIKTLHRLLSCGCLLIRLLWVYAGLLKHCLRFCLHSRGRLRIEAEAVRHDSLHYFLLLCVLF